MSVRISRKLKAKLHRRRYLPAELARFLKLMVKFLQLRRKKVTSATSPTLREPWSVILTGRQTASGWHISLTNLASISFFSRIPTAWARQKGYRWEHRLLFTTSLSGRRTARRLFSVI